MNKSVLYFKYENSSFYIIASHSATAQNCLKVKEEFERIVADEKELDNIYVDLSNCEYMDSTFMGVLMGFSSLLNEKKGIPLTILKVCDKSFTLLKEMGLNVLFKYSQDDIPFPKSMQESLNGNEIQIDDILEAHQNLSSISEENKNKFQSLMDILKAQKNNKNKP